MLVRILLILIGHFLIELPDSSADAVSFERVLEDSSKRYSLFINGPLCGPSPKFIVWIISLPYSLFGRSMLMAQSLSMLFGIGCVLIGWMLAKKVFDKR